MSTRPTSDLSPSTRLGSTSKGQLGDHPETVFESHPARWLLYGQTYLFGEELRQVVGWETLKVLATLRTAEGFPDVEAWIASLTTAEVREKAARLVLGSAAL